MPPCCTTCFTSGERSASGDLQSHLVAHLIIQRKISTSRTVLAHVESCSYSCGGLVSTTDLHGYLLEEADEVFVYAACHGPTGSSNTMQQLLHAARPWSSHYRPCQMDTSLVGEDLRCRHGVCTSWCAEFVRGAFPAGPQLQFATQVYAQP